MTNDQPDQSQPIDKAVALMHETQGLVWGATPNASPET
jgi:hypothetical protein